MSRILIVYDSLTGNVKRFVGKLPFEAVPLSEAHDITQPFCLVTYTVGFGQVPKSTAAFLAKHSDNLLGVASSGNRNWGDCFAKAARLISSAYGVPILHTFELSGTDADVNTFIFNAESLVGYQEHKMSS